MTPSMTETESPIQLKTLELCRTVLEQPETQMILKRIETFMGDDEARSQYDVLMSKGQTLRQKQESGLHLSDAEISEFEQARQSLIGNPVAREFLEAQEEMGRIRDTVQHYVTKTFELGRVPNAEDFQSCGHGCSCGH
jgi:cell fate (sporulation/competence/biofilm development) regulator YlbF (YheA/YmcA/DUF963 family)